MRNNSKINFANLRFLVCSLFLCLSVTYSYGQNKDSVLFAKRTDTINNLLSRIENSSVFTQKSDDQEIGKKVEKVLALKKNFEATEKANLYTAVISNLTKIANEYGITVSIKFTTHKPGASVRYRSITENDPHTCSDDTNKCLAAMAAGRCIFWSERGGKKTSRDYDEVFSDDGSFLIEETQQ